ncbi:MAG: TatD family nuclease-associated radical SAM protein [Gammaproteobacteria bacterium]
MRLNTLIETARVLHEQGARVRVNTDGLANLVHGRNVTPELGGLVDALSISLNAQDEDTYNQYCRPKRARAYRAMLDFVARARDQVPQVTVTAIDGLAGVDIEACARIADRLGVTFRRRILNQVG